MEFEYFIREEEWEKQFEYWQKEMMRWIDAVGISKKNVHEVKVPKEELAHYSKRTTDLYFDFPFGQKELYGLAYRTDFDLKNHSASSGQSLLYSEEGGEPFTPRVIEPTFGLDRTVLAVLASAYAEDEMNGEKRVVLKLKPALAPITVAVFPLLKNKPELVKKAEEVFALLRKDIDAVAFDDNGNIGKRYRRQDEIGTPFCITVDFDSLEKDDVTVRNRDSGKQERIPIPDLPIILKARLV
jgi:glycyl-tRNA synthetase